MKIYLRLLYAISLIIDYENILAFTKTDMASKTKDLQPPAKRSVLETGTLNKAIDDFPTTIEGFGYKFQDGEKLVNIKTGKPFEFNVSTDEQHNQLHYEALGQVINEYVYELLEKEAKLERISIPVEATGNEAKSFFFASENAFTTSEKLLILVHGSGVVRAGQWARRLIINDGLSSGTQLPFIKRAVEQGYGIVVLNTNQNKGLVGEKNMSVKGNETPERHVQYVWKNFIMKSTATHVAIIAHSYGGVCIMELTNLYLEEMRERVFAIALTDSVHRLDMQDVPVVAIDWLKTVGQNWVSSTLSLDTPIDNHGRIDVPCVSAGVQKHEMTSWASIDSIFKFLMEKYQSFSHSNEKKTPKAEL